jgi:transposase
MRVVGLDVHRAFAEAVMPSQGEVTRLGRVGMARDHLAAFARRLTHDDHVVIEATGNATAVVEAIGPHVGRVVIANPRQVRLIAEARIKNDVVDATVLARLYASGFLPEVWVPDQRTLARRRQVTRRNQIVRQRARLKTIVRSILHAHLVPPWPPADPLGPVARFAGPDKLVAHLGLDPSVHQSGEGRPRHGRITKQGRTHARTMLVEAAWRAVRGPGPPRASYHRVATRRGQHIAAVAVARKLAAIVWHLLRRGEGYARVRPALHAKKLRDLELRSGQPARRGQRGMAYAYNLARTRLVEKRRAEQAETAYRKQTEGWSRRGPRAPTDAATEGRR